MFLSRVAISDFRAFPADFRLDLTPGPGVTLIVGQNGLGKSTFFEALEWCLTGEVKRLKDLPVEGSRKADFLARRMPDGTEASRYGVELTFQPDAPVRFARWREKSGGSYSPTVEPSEVDLINALKSSAWREPILTLGSYLRLTHFLSQAGEQRFAARDSKERWSALESPAGTERLNRLRERLGNRGVTAAFNRRVKDAETEIDAGETEVRRWDELIKRRDNARSLAQSGGAISPSELLSKLELVRADVTAHFGECQFENASSVERCLQQIAARLETERSATSARIERARAIFELPRQWGQTLGDHAVIESTRESAQKRIEESKLIAANIRKQLDEAETVKKQLSAERERLARDRSRLSQLMTTQAALQEHQSAVQGLVTKVRDAEASLSTATLIAQASAKELDSRRRLDRDFASATERFDSTRELLNLHQRYLKSQSDASSAANRLATSDASLASVESEAREVEAERARLNSALVSAEDRANRLQFQASTIETCLASLASVITDDDTRCPVCATGFPPRELRRLVTQTAGLASDGLAAAEALIETTKRSLRALQSQADKIEGLRAEHSRIANAAATAQGAADALLAAIRLHPLIASAPVGVSIPDRIIAVHTESMKQLESATSAIREAKPLADCERAATEAEVERRSSDSRLSRLREEVAKFQTLISQAEATLARADGIPASGLLDLPGIISQLVDGEGDVLASQTTNDALIAGLITRVRQSAAELESLQAEMKSAEVRAAESGRQFDLMKSSWSKAGFTGEPSTESLQLHLDEQHERQRRLAELETRHKTLLEGYRAWTKAEEFRDLQQRVAEALQLSNMSTENDIRQSLMRRVDAARQKLHQGTEARAFREVMLKKLESEARNYANKVLTPLNSLNENFLQVFSCFSNLSVSLGAKTHQSSVKLELVLKWLANSTDANTSASIRHFLSEGQLSALSVSLLLSMSTAYRWSRWRALVLDDPLQHNDVIHATSFIEVLRNLVRFQEYQVLLSTHDLELADFIRRKMTAANVDCRTCHFLGNRSNGVHYKVL